MSTNKRNRSRHAVVDLPEVKRRRRLENLLHTRKRVAVLSAEHRSHRLDDHLELYLLELEIEQVLADEFPEEFDEHVGSWAEVEASAEHHPLTTSPDCSLCRAVAKRLGVAEAPDAA